MVSVVIPCYNYGRYLRECVESVLAQTYPELEIVIVDDESTDGSVAVAQELIAQYQHRPLRLIGRKHTGMAAASRNAGIAAAQGEYILPLDADDRIAPLMIERCLALLEADPQFGFVYTDRRDFGDEERLVPARDYDIETLKQANYIPCCSLFRRRVWEDVGGYRLNVNGAEDWDFWLAAYVKGWRGRRLREPLFEYRRHDGGLFNEVLKDPAAKRAQAMLNNHGLFTREEVEEASAVLYLSGVLTRIRRYWREGKHDMVCRIIDAELPVRMRDQIRTSLNGGSGC